MTFDQIEDKNIRGIGVKGIGHLKRFFRFLQIQEFNRFSWKYFYVLFLSRKDDSYKALHLTSIRMKEIG